MSIFKKSTVRKLGINSALGRLNGGAELECLGGWGSDCDVRGTCPTSQGSRYGLPESYPQSIPVEGSTSTSISGTRLCVLIIAKVLILEVGYACCSKLAHATSVAPRVITSSTTVISSGGSRSAATSIEPMCSNIPGRFSAEEVDDFLTAFVRASSSRTSFPKPFDAKTSAITIDGQTPPSVKGALLGAGTNVTCGFRKGLRGAALSLPRMTTAVSTIWALPRFIFAQILLEVFDIPAVPLGE